MPPALVPKLTELARLSLDLGAPVLEQLVLTHLLSGPSADAAAQRDRLRVHRDVLAAELRSALPQWSFRLPSGGLSLWVEPRPVASALAAGAEREGLVITPGLWVRARGWAGVIRAALRTPTGRATHPAVRILTGVGDAGRHRSGHRPRASADRLRRRELYPPVTCVMSDGSERLRKHPAHRPDALRSIDQQLGAAEPASWRAHRASGCPVPTQAKATSRPPPVATRSLTNLGHSRTASPVAGVLDVAAGHNLSAARRGRPRRPKTASTARRPASPARVARNASQSIVEAFLAR